MNIPRSGEESMKKKRKAAQDEDDDDDEEEEEEEHGWIIQHKIDEKVLDPWKYLLGSPGKSIRSKIIDAFQIWFKIPSERVMEIKQIIDDLHTASLLIDDIEDGSTLRRGKPVAHNIYGIPMTMNCANYVYFIALEKCIKLSPVNGVKIFTEELLNLHRGQGQDILWRDSLQCPNLDEYLAMIQDKTGGLFRLGLRLMQSFSDDKRDFIKLTNQLAVYFQVRDDLLNLASSQYQKNKSYCEDLTEGKFSFPIIHSIQADPTDSRILSILKQRTKDEDVKKCAVDWMRSNTKSFEATRMFLDTVENDIRNHIQSLGGHEPLLDIMTSLSEEVHECSNDNNN